MLEPYKTENLLREAGRPLQLFVGWVCAVISALAAVLLLGCGYLLVYRKPPEDVPRAGFLVFLVIVLLIAVGFSVVAFRLLRRGRTSSRLISPLMLRVWGLFFGLASAGILVDGVVRKRWAELPYYWEICFFSITMACAAFILARKRSLDEASERLSGKSQWTKTSSSEINQTPAAAASRPSP